MSAIRTVFPDSSAILCTWHILEDFKKNLSDSFKDKKDKELCLDLVRVMINSLTKEQLQQAHRKYQEIASNKSLLKDPANCKAPTYFCINWEPIKHMWAG